MQSDTIVAVSTVCASVVSAVHAWAWQRVARKRGRETAGHQHVRHLPVGSRIVDLGDRGLLIDIGHDVRSPDGRR